MMTQRKSPCHKNDDDVSKDQQALDVEPKSLHKNSTGHNRALDEQSDADVSETSDTYNLPMSLKYHVMLQAAKTPEFTFRKEPSDIDKLVMAKAVHESILDHLDPNFNDSHSCGSLAAGDLFSQVTCY
jgi:hypothetical protein